MVYCNTTESLQTDFSLQTRQKSRKSDGLVTAYRLNPELHFSLEIAERKMLVMQQEKEKEEGLSSHEKVEETDRGRG